MSMNEPIITAAQIRGARAILKWSQDDLAKRADISVNSVKNIESEVTVPRQAMMQKIRKTFELSGLAFLPNNGVSRSDEKIKVYEDKEGYLAFFHDVYETALADKRPIVVNGVDERQFDELFFANEGPELMDEHQARINSIDHLDFRVIIEDGDPNHCAADHVQYRSIPSDIFPKVTSYVYGDKVAIIIWGRPHRILIVNDHDMAEAFRINFDQFWQKSKHVRDRIRIE